MVQAWTVGLLLYLSNDREKWDLKLCVYMCVYLCVYVSVCPPPRTLIISSVIWCDIGHVRLVKQGLQLSPAIICFIWQLPLIEWMGMAILTQHIVNTCQRKLRWCGTSYKGLRWCGTSYKGLPKRWSASFIKVSGRILSTGFKIRPAFGFTVIILA